MEVLNIPRAHYSSLLLSSALPAHRLISDYNVGGSGVLENTRGSAVATPPIMLGMSVWTLACLLVV
jgi:hypothetical protein